MITHHGQLLLQLSSKLFSLDPLIAQSAENQMMPQNQEVMSVKEPKGIQNTATRNNMNNSSKQKRTNKTNRKLT